MDELDSRSLGITDCFVQRFPVGGAVHYRVERAPAPECLPVVEARFVIDVGAAGRQPPAEGRQHNVAVRLVGGRLEADPARLEIDVGDSVRWHARASPIRFRVRGEGAEFAFDSGAMGSECAYTHAFAIQGRYQWADANGGPTVGEVEVTNPDTTDPEQCRQWAEALKKGTTIKIEGERVEPGDVRILTGQTVAWVVIRASGITVTDKRSLPPSPE